ncbi:MAG: entericidin [Zetaproteobacteria bacterium CG_4_9_14_3_um_filter_49_83]|nr:MAG: entericidin [Zetaproteobacteria bacterium CG1_02_49_23]PIQ30114.1 MAG: entericidin [Zetaproteobacteria bacterium CG17_big_fil_post_rev_8_21_14_2_50_50_13]PIV31516.1 MAG: entericidin [Zetaproteobacteria bacterium CG02_land_8_20_14_3_00_50_9]PIY55938.1 MAG: entericidin [Zetaproteobacteria bacterium CG_4_10_14_0_8_um_filter_49_80]PJA36385.1 MAG: entericidin [Zetaproteobacteria bacterium CG_4_9_14_3_um_filter_49_83]
MFRVIFILLAFISLSATAALTGCHTMSGAGQDIEQGGEAISDEADKHTD